MKAIHIVIASALITAAAIKAAPAFAEPAAAEIHISVVRTADLDLSSNAGQRELEVRLARAARAVCGTASDMDLEGKNDIRHCRDEVLARARAQRDELIATKKNGRTITVAAAR